MMTELELLFNIRVASTFLTVKRNQSDFFFQDLKDSRSMSLHVAFLGHFINRTISDIVLISSIIYSDQLPKLISSVLDNKFEEISH